MGRRKLRESPHDRDSNRRVVQQVAQERQERMRQPRWKFRSIHDRSALLAGFRLHASVRVGLLFSGRQDPHLLPVVGKLLAAIKTHDVRACLRSGLRAVLLPPAGDGEAHAFVPASEQSVEDSHHAPPEPEIQTECPEGIAHKNHRRVRGTALADWASSAGTSVTYLVALNPDSFHWFSATRDKSQWLAEYPCFQ
jgi:hypothetical protein